MPSKPSLPPARALALVALGLMLVFLVGFDAASQPGAPLSQAPSAQLTPTPTFVPIGPENPLGQYVKKNRLRALVAVTLAGAGLALLVRRVTR